MQIEGEEDSLENPQDVRSIDSDIIQPNPKESDEEIKKRKKRQAQAPPPPPGDIEDFVEIRDLTPVTQANDTDLFLIDDGAISTNSIKFKDLLNKIKDRTFKSENSEEKDYLKDIIRNIIANTLKDDHNFVESVYRKVIERLSKDRSSIKELFTKGFGELEDNEKQKYGKEILTELEKLPLKTHDTYSKYSSDNYYFVGRHSDNSDGFRQYKMPGRVFGEVPYHYSKGSVFKQSVPFRTGSPATPKYPYARQSSDTWLPISGDYYIERVAWASLADEAVSFNFGHYIKPTDSTIYNQCLAIGIEPSQDQGTSDFTYVYLDWSVCYRFNRTSNQSGNNQYLIVLYNATDISNYETGKILTELQRGRNVTVLWHAYSGRTGTVFCENKPIYKGWHKIIYDNTGAPRLLKV